MPIAHKVLSSHDLQLARDARRTCPAFCVDNPTGRLWSGPANRVLQNFRGRLRLSEGDVAGAFGQSVSAPQAGSWVGRAV